MGLLLEENGYISIDVDSCQQWHHRLSICDIAITSLVNMIYITHIQTTKRLDVSMQMQVSYQNRNFICLVRKTRKKRNKMRKNSAKSTYLLQLQIFHFRDLHICSLQPSGYSDLIHHLQLASIKNILVTRY